MTFVRSGGGGLPRSERGHGAGLRRRGIFELRVEQPAVAADRQWRVNAHAWPGTLVRKNLTILSEPCDSFRDFSLAKLFPASEDTTLFNMQFTRYR